MRLNGLSWFQTSSGGATNEVAKLVANGNNKNSTLPIEPDLSWIRKKPPRANSAAITTPIMTAVMTLLFSLGASGSGG